MKRTVSPSKKKVKTLSSPAKTTRARTGKQDLTVAALRKAGAKRTAKLPARSKSQVQTPSKTDAPDPKLGRYAVQLLEWYDRHRRLLPWRALPNIAPDPYRVWLSEIMLQQTTVAAVGPYFQKFVTRWPTLEHLASAPIDEIMAMWAGLGYYRRARMLYECAQTLVADFHGQFPRSVPELSSLPGFGPYTAAAVGAIAFDQRANVVDGNVERVISRLFAVQTAMPAAKGEIRALAGQLLPTARYGDYAQALMDLGATICTPRSPKCMLCPLSNLCEARRLGIAESLPVRSKVKSKPVRRAMAFVLTNSDGELFLRMRPPEGLLGGMLELPSSPWLGKAIPKLDKATDYAPTAALWKVLPGIVKHVFTHFTLEIGVASATLPRKNFSNAGSGKNGRGLWIAFNRLDKVALPSVMHKIVRHAIKHSKI